MSATYQQNATDTELAAAIAAEHGDTSDVHGIPDTSVLAKYTTAGSFTKGQSIASDVTGTPALTVKAATGQTYQPVLKGVNADDETFFEFHPGSDLSNNNQAGLRLYQVEPDMPPWQSFHGTNGAWGLGIDGARVAPHDKRDLFIGKHDHPIAGSFLDTVYLSHNGSAAPTVGIGFVPPTLRYKVQISPDDAEADMGGVAVRVAPTLTGNPLGFIDSATGNMALAVQKDMALITDGTKLDGVTVRASGKAYATRARRSVVLADNGGATAVHGFWHASDGTITYSNFTGGVDMWSGKGAAWRHLSTSLGFYGANATTKQTVTGSRGGNAALASLLTALATLGLITDSSSA